jgi:hypothetical protein
MVRVKEGEERSVKPVLDDSPASQVAAPHDGAATAHTADITGQNTVNNRLVWDKSGDAKKHKQVQKLQEVAAAAAKHVKQLPDVKRKSKQPRKRGRRDTDTIMATDDISEGEGDDGDKDGAEDPVVTESEGASPPSHPPRNDVPCPADINETGGSPSPWPSATYWRTPPAGLSAAL